MQIKRVANCKNYNKSKGQDVTAYSTIHSSRTSKSSFEKNRPVELTALTYAVKAIEGYSLKGASHHGVLLQHLVEVVHRERVQPTVCVRSDAGCSSASSQQTDLCGHFAT